jgi:uncharacterized protein (TIGR03083 family)
MAGKQEVIDCLRNLRDEVAALVEGAPADAWSAETYEESWTAKDVLAHIASTSAPAGYLLSIASLPGGSDESGGFDNEAFNRQQTAMRADRTPQQLLDEIRANVQRDIQAVESASGDLLEKHFAAPWGVEGTVAEVIITAASGHIGGHIADLRGALGA